VDNFTPAASVRTAPAWPRAAPELRESLAQHGMGLVEVDCFVDHRVADVLYVSNHVALNERTSAPSAVRPSRARRHVAPGNFVISRP
jgi:hypothetical protein